MKLKEKVLFGTIIIVISGVINYSLFCFLSKKRGMAEKKDLSSLVNATDAIFTALYYLEKGTGPSILDPDLRVRLDDQLEIARESLKDIGLRKMRMKNADKK
ncbi:MAG: hypothetical protein DRQ88_00380 [Epsilonproteobacteria bacterium]|nr:MAG: hypothetical protein DRQ89_03460 [Campylobacterota bacterium]RLA68092.1 MAG: hypothetical protein DRQ88_00380 [Campylobacterota bacterium]